MKKKPYARIEYINCSTDYDYTICELSDIEQQIEVFKTDNEDLDAVGYNNWKDHGKLPAITITLVMLTDAEYLKWFRENVEDHA